MGSSADVPAAGEVVFLDGVVMVTGWVENTELSVTG